MSHYIPQHYAAATLFRIGAWLHDAARVLRSTAERLDILVAERRKAIDDHRALSEMSERELRDIGVVDVYAHALRNSDCRHGYDALGSIEWRHPT